MPTMTGPTVEDVTIAIEELQIGRLTRETAAQAQRMGRAEARYLVDAYYQIQDYRKAAGNQVTAGDHLDAPAMPFVEWLGGHMERTEGYIKGLLGHYAQAQPAGAWSMSQYGIGPVISAGLLAHIDIRRCPAMGNLWAYAGLDPSQEWLGAKGAEALVKRVREETGLKGLELAEAVAIAAKRKPANFIALLKKPDGEPLPPTVANIQATLARRPWNARLKVLCWKIGQSFNRFQHRDDCWYGKRLQERKAYEVARSDNGECADAAAAKLEKFKIGKETKAYAHYAAGKLPPAHLQARAERWVAKLFLGHWWQVAWEAEFGRPAARPYVIEFGGHSHVSTPPGYTPL